MTTAAGTEASPSLKRFKISPYVLEMQSLFSFRKETLVIRNVAGVRLAEDTGLWNKLLDEDYPKCGIRPCRIL